MRNSFKNNLHNYYTAVPNAVATDTRLSHGAVRVFLYLAGQDDSFIFWNPNIMKSLGIKKEHTLSKYLKELLDTNWISRKKNKFNGYDYELHPTSRTKNVIEDLRESINNPAEAQTILEVRAEGFHFSIKTASNEYVSLMLTNKSFYIVDNEEKLSKKKTQELWEHIYNHRLNDVLKYVNIKEKRR